MYITPEHGCVRLASQLINAFLHYLKQCNEGSPLIKYLLTENANPSLKAPVDRRLLNRRGFEFMVFNILDNEIGSLPCHQ
jgi:hypothetical protein